MSDLKPLRSLTAPRAEPLDARQRRKGRSVWVLLALALLLATAGGVAGAFAFMRGTGSTVPRPSDAEALEAHLREAGVEAKIRMMRLRETRASWQALLDVESGGVTRTSSLVRYDSEPHAIAESRGTCAATWNTCARRGSLVLTVREDSWSAKDPARANMLAAFASFLD